MFFKREVGWSVTVARMAIAEDFYTNALRQCRLFDGLSEFDLRSLHPACTRLRIKTGEALFQAGSPGGSLYVVVAGQLAIETNDPSRAEIDGVVHLGLRGPGEVVGEFSLFDDKVRSATVRATSTSTVIQIDGRTFRLILEQSNRLAIHLIKILIAKLVESQHQTTIRETSKLNVRLAKCLLDLAGQHAHGRTAVLTDAPTQKLLARRLGCSREAVSRAARSFGTGVVVFGRSNITLNDVPTLKRIVERERVS